MSKKINQLIRPRLQIYHYNISIIGLNDLKPRMTTTAAITFADGSKKEIELLVRIDTEDELEYYRHDGILHYVLRNLVGEAA